MDGLPLKRTHFVWDGSRLFQEIHSDGRYTYIYTDPDIYEPLAQVHTWINENRESSQQTHYFHCDQIDIPREITDKNGNLLWFFNYTGWGRLKKDERVYKDAHQPIRLQNQYYDEETGLHYNLMRYYEPEAGRFVNQDPIGLWGGENLYQFAPNATMWLDPLGWKGVTVSKASKGSAFDFILKLDSAVYPETAQHIKDAIASGKPSVVIIDRKGAAGRKKEALSDIPDNAKIKFEIVKIIER